MIDNVKISDNETECRVCHSIAGDNGVIARGNGCPNCTVPNEFVSKRRFAEAKEMTSEQNPCLCESPAGSPHHPLCPYHPPYGYDSRGVPHEESQIGKIAAEFGRKLEEAFQERFLQLLRESK